MAKFQKRVKARELRRKGESILSIAQKLSVSKGSVSLWCRDIELSKSQKERLIRYAASSRYRAALKGAQANKKKKERVIEYYARKGAQDVASLSKRDLLMAGIALYWGEGAKDRKVALVNSDPKLILFMYRWFQEILGVKKEEFMPRIFINETHRPRIKKVVQYWSVLLGLPEAQFGNPTFLKTPHRKVYENHDSYYGVLSLRVRNSSEISYQIAGLIDALKEAE